MTSDTTVADYFAGKRVLVTGAGDSVGRAIAERFLSKGAHVHICDVRADAVAATLAANPRLTGSVTDVGNRSDVDRLFADVGEALEGITGRPNKKPPP